MRLLFKNSFLFEYNDKSTICNGENSNEKFNDLFTRYNLL